MNNYEYDDGYIKYQFVDLDGNPIKRTPFTHPYNYDEYVIWKDKDFDEKIHSAVYSDRLYQWDYEKYNKCCHEVFKVKGQHFGKADPKNIEKFLSMYFDKDIKLKAVTQGCNQADGNAYWVFFYEE